MITPDNVCAHAAEQNTKIRIERKEDFILIEGTREGLTFLGNLILAQANSSADSSFSIDPSGAGNLLFTDNSNIGIYLHTIESAVR